MGYVWQRWLADEFRAAGLTVIEVEGWKNRGRPASTGNFEPEHGVTTHHTGTTTSPANPGPTLQLLIKGRPDLPGPLCQWTTRHDGLVVVIAAGRANHAGRVGKPGVPGMPLGADGNARALGNEVDTNGTQPLTDAQRRSIAIANAVVLKHYENSPDRAHRHEDISGTGKWDLGSLTTPQLRTDARVALRELSSRPAPTPNVTAFLQAKTRRARREAALLVQRSGNQAARARATRWLAADDRATTAKGEKRQLVEELRELEVKR